MFKKKKLEDDGYKKIKATLSKDEEEFDEYQDLNEEEEELIPTPKKKRKVLVEEKEEESVWELVEVPTQTTMMIQNSNTKQRLDLYGAIVEILNRTE